MDGSRFDAWTRRRFGLATGGLAAALLGLASADDDADAKKKRCKKLGKTCRKGKRGKKCCKRLSCKKIGGAGKKRCCKDLGDSCALEEDCCTGFCGDDECQPAFCKDLGQDCAVDENCCSNNCLAFECAPPV